MGTDWTDPKSDPMSPAHVLVVAADETVRTNLAALVRQVGYRGAVAPDLAAAKQLIAASWVRFDVIVLDAADAEQAGDPVTDAAVAELTARHDIGVVHVTAPDDIRTMTPMTPMTPMADQGVVGFVTVPVSAAKLLRSIAAVLRPLQARRRNAWYAEIVKIQQRKGDVPVIDITGTRADSKRDL